MDLSNRSAYIAAPGVVLTGICIALAGSQEGSQIAGIPVFALCVGLTYLIQWAVFTFSYLKQTEKYYDLTGSLTYISMTLMAVLLSQNVDSRSVLLLVMIMIWAGRLGSFLFIRIKKAGKDGRFDTLKTSFIRFLTAWTTQGLWVIFTSSAAWTAITTTTRKPLGVYAFCGFMVWIFGFSFEVVSDMQKRRFRANPENQDKFIQTGLWSLSRHPNYFGEIVLWIGVAIIAMPVLRGWQWVTLISPVFVAVLLTQISGIPPLEKRANDRWGGQEDYESYKTRTPVLVPRLPF